MVQRRIPRPRDLAPLLRFKAWESNTKKRRLAQALTLDGLRLIPQRRTPQAPYERAARGMEFKLRSLGAASPSMSSAHNTTSNVVS
jgi:L-lactate dehydrogenase (cytochrome)